MTVTASAAEQAVHCSSAVAAGLTSQMADDSSRAEQTATTAASSDYLIIVAWPGAAWTVAWIWSAKVAASLQCFACSSRHQASWLTRSFARGGTLGPAPAAIVA